MALFDLLETGQNLSITHGVSASQKFAVSEAGPLTRLKPPIEGGPPKAVQIAVTG
jgi:hypothetical protein